VHANEVPLLVDYGDSCLAEEISLMKQDRNTVLLDLYAEANFGRVFPNLATSDFNDFMIPYVELHADPKVIEIFTAAKILSSRSKLKMARDLLMELLMSLYFELESTKASNRACSFEQVHFILAQYTFETNVASNQNRLLYYFEEDKEVIQSILVELGALFVSINPTNSLKVVPQLCRHNSSDLMP
jgi:hypothetical protein